MVVHVKPRDLYDMGEGNEDMYENEPYAQQEFDQFFDIQSENIQLARDGVDEDEVR